MTNQNTNKEFRGNRNYDAEKRSNSINLTKTFPTFEDGFVQLAKFIPEIKVYCGDDISINSVIGHILDTIKDNIPSTENNRYPNTFALSIDSHEVGLKTDSGIAFGWRTYYQKHDEGSELVYKFRVTFVVVNAHHKVIINNMKENDWESFETMRQGRFWNRSVGSRPSRRRFDPNRNVEEAPKQDSEKEENTTVVEQEKVSEEVVVDMEKPINEDIASQLNLARFDNDKVVAVKSEMAANCCVE